MSSDPIASAISSRSRSESSVRPTTRDVRARVRRIATRWDVSTHASECAPATLAMNDIGHVVLDLAEPIAADSYAANRSTGSFILVDDVTNGTVAAGLIRPAA